MARPEQQLLSEEKREQRIRERREDRQDLVDRLGEGFIELHLRPFFLIRKTSQEREELLSTNGYPIHFDSFKLPADVKEELWREISVPEDGLFTFRPDIFYLGQSVEEIVIPNNQLWKMEDNFLNKKTGEYLPLLTNFTAPHLKPGSRGPQIFEIKNMSGVPLVLPLSDLVCLTHFLPLTGDVEKATNQFGTQKNGEIRLGEV